MKKNSSDLTHRFSKSPDQVELDLLKKKVIDQVLSQPEKAALVLTSWIHSEKKKSKKN